MGPTQPSYGYSTQQHYPGFPPQGYPPPGFVPQHTIPGTVVTACVLWMIYGALALGSGALALAGGGKIGVMNLVFGAAFLITGIQVLMGKASQLIGSGVVCIVLGTLQTIGFFLLVGSLGRAAMWIPGWLVAIVVINSVVLILAGILAIVGNAAFRNWRLTKGIR